MKNSELSPASRRKDRELLIIVSLFGLSLLHELILATGLFPLSRPLTFGVRLAQLFLAERCIQFVDLRSNKWLLIPWAGMLVVFLTSFFREGTCPNELCYRCGRIEECRRERKEKCF